MKRNGPKDYAYAILYDRKDADYINKLQSSDLFALIEKKWNDHNPSIITEISRADDIVTFPGLAYCSQLILGTQTTRFSFYGCGSSAIKADPLRQTLVSEASSRMNM